MNALTILLLGSAHGATVTVNAGDDLVSFFAGAAAGDELVLGPGIHEVSSTLNITDVVSTAAAPLVIRGEEGAVIKLVEAEDGGFANPIMRVSGASHVRLEGFTLEGGDGWASDLDHAYTGLSIGSSTGVTLDGLTIQDLTRTGIYLYELNSDVLVTNTEIRNTQDGHGIYVGCSDVSCFTTTFTAHTNLIHDIGGEGSVAINLQHGTQGALLVDNIIYNIEYRGIESGSTELGDPTVMEGNALWNIGDIGVVLRGAATVRNNILFNITGRGIVARDPDRAAYSDQIIVYNTIVDTDGYGLDLESWMPDMGFVLANNAVCNPLSYGVLMTKTVPEGQLAEDIETPGTVANNFVCGLVEGLDPELGEVVAAGGYDDFSDVELWDFYPTSASLLIDAADPAGKYYPPELDFNGNPREGDAPDVGAYEFVGEDNPGWAIREGFKEYLTYEEERSGGAVESGCCSKDKGGEEALLLIPLLGLGALRRRRVSGRGPATPTETQCTPGDCAR